MTELFSNLGQTTINQVGGISATDTTVVVSGLNGTNPGNSLPSSGNFRIIFGTDASSEIALCTAVNTTNNTLTIVRAQEGTVAQAWANGTLVTVSVTAQALNQLMADVFSVGSYQNRPLFGRPTGSRYQTTDGHTPWVWDPTTGQWRPEVCGVLGWQPPSASLFTAQNQSTGAIADINGAIQFTGVADNSFNTIRTWTISAPSCSLVEGAFILTPKSSSSPTAGNVTIAVIMRESSSGKIVASGITLLNGTNGFTAIMIGNGYSSNTTRSLATQTCLALGTNPFFFRCRRDATNLYFEYSGDRINWVILTTQALTSVFTTAPDQVGFGTVGEGAGVIAFGYITSFRYETFMPSSYNNVYTPGFKPVLAPPPPPPTIAPIGWISPIIRQ